MDNWQNGGTSCVPIWCAPWPDSILGGQPRHPTTPQKCIQVVEVAAWSKRRSFTIQRPFLGRRTVRVRRPSCNKVEPNRIQYS